jgi:ribonuclease P protein component
MLGRGQRLTDARIFQSLFQRGSWVKGTHLSLRVMPSKQNGQVAFVVSKKITKHASSRNTMKRKLRALFRELGRDTSHQAALNRHHILVVVHRNFVDMAYTELRSELEMLLRRVNTRDAQ